MPEQDWWNAGTLFSPSSLRWFRRHWHQSTSWELIDHPLQGCAVVSISGWLLKEPPQQIKGWLGLGKGCSWKLSEWLKFDLTPRSRSTPQENTECRESRWPFPTIMGFNLLSGPLIGHFMGAYRLTSHLKAWTSRLLKTISGGFSIQHIAVLCTTTHLTIIELTFHSQISRHLDTFTFTFYVAQIRWRNVSGHC